MQWIIPKGCQDSVGSADFNAPLPENDGGVCIAEEAREYGQNEADADIREGRVKEFDNPDDLIASLKKPW